MMRVPSMLPVLLVCGLGAWSSVGCGLRSDVLLDEPQGTDDGDEGEEDDGDDGGGRQGTCDLPSSFPSSGGRVSGELSGSSRLRGWCGADAGPEVVYRIAPDTDVDVSLSLASADFSPTLRVREGGCEDGDDVPTLVCDPGFSNDEFGGRHFFARAGQEYYVVVDSASGDGGEYALDVSFEPVPLSSCPLHGETIVQDPGGAFLWRNDLSSGQGRVDGACGGPGRENMFVFLVSQPGFVAIIADATDGFEPIVSLRRGCGGVTEVACSGNDGTGSAFLETQVDPGEYYIVVDQGGRQGGSYELNVFFE